MPDVLEELLIGVGYKVDTKKLETARKKARKNAKDAEQAYEDAAKAVETAQDRVAEASTKAAKKQAKEALRAAKKTAKAAKESMGAAKAAAKEAAQAADEAANQNAASAEKFREAWVGGTKKVGLALGGMAVAGAAAALAFTDHLVERSRELDIWTEKISTSARELQRLEKAGERVNVPLDNMREGVKTFRENLGELERLGTGPARDSLGSLGLTLEDLQGLGVEEQLGVLSDALQGVESDAQKLSIAIELMGEDGAAMIPILNKGSKGIKELGDQAEDAGQIMDDQLIAQTRELDKIMKESRATVEGAGLTIATALIPVVQESAKGFQQWVKDNDDLIKQDLPELLGRVAEAFGFVADMVGKVASGIADLTSWIDKLDEADFLSRLDAMGIETRRVTKRGLNEDEMEVVSGEGVDMQRLRQAREAKADVAEVDRMFAAVEDLAEEQTQAKGRRDTAAKRRKRGASFNKTERTAASGGGGGGKSAEQRQAEEELAEALVQVRTTGVEEELEEMGARAGATDKAVQKATDAAAKKFAEGASRQVAKKAGVGVLSSMTGVDLSKRETDPLLSAIFGDDQLPDVPLSELERGQQPQVLISTINNSYTISVANQIHGAGRDSESIAGDVVDLFREMFDQEVAAASKMSKAVFAR